MKEWKFEKKIEDMNEQETRERIRQGFEYPMSKLVLMPYLGGESKVTYSTRDFVARCPATGLDDVYALDIVFTPGEYIPELKSLKLYFNEFQDLPISHEHLGYKLYKEFNDQVQPKKLDLKLVAAVRGGIETIVEVNKK